MTRTTFAALGLVLVAAVPAFAADATGPAREVRIVRAPSSIAIDGNLSEAAWQSAPRTDGFKQRDPNEGMDASQPTEVMLLYDDEALYVGVRLHDAHADSIVSLLTRRDGGSRSDQFRLFLDPYFDRRSGYFFGINAAGTLYDGTLYNDGWSDNSWDGVWDGSARVDPQGWTAEMRIPFSQLRFAKAEPQRWGINFQRSMGRGFEDSYLVFQPKKESGFVSRFPTLVGLENVSPGNAIELVPFLTSKGEFLRHDAADPFNDGSRMNANAGGDLRMPVGDKLTFNGTVNPDFGQVEVDPAVVNLSDVETFFPEKRPFFVEGRSIFEAGQQGASDYWGFNWQQPTFFYSRRIGRAPQGGLPRNTFRDVPNGTTILGAGKLSGKLGSGINVGTLHAITSRETADLMGRSGNFPRTEGYEVEPLAYYGVGRMLKEFPERRHGLGLIGTVTARQFETARLDNEFDRSALVGAIDGWHYLDANKTWILSGWAGGTHVTGTRQRITDLQSNSRHYYQRPDATSFELDTLATSLSGHGARVWLNKEKGSWFSNSAIGYLSPGFEVNDLGFLNRADMVNAHSGVGYNWTKPTKHVRHHNALLAAFGSTNLDGDVTSSGLWGKKFWWFTNNWTTELRAAYYPEAVNPRRSRGGPRMLDKPGYEFGTFFDTDGGRTRYYYIDAGGTTQPEEDSWSWYANLGFTYKPLSNLVIQLGPSMSRSRDGAYYFATLDDANATATYGKRYIFSTLDQTTLSANIRLNVSFTPALSLEFFGQPLISNADYHGLKELARPKSLDFVGPGAGAWTYDPATGLFDPDGPGGDDAYSEDFNFKSLRGNAVFRWEYMPGSTFFLVWTQERTDRAGVHDFDVSHDLRRLADADADNIFLAKVTYYLSR